MKKLIILTMLLLFFGCVEETETVDADRDGWMADNEDIIVSQNASAILITAPDCFSCDYGDYILFTVQTQELGTTIVDVTRLEHNSTQAKLLISHYEIEKLPTLILKKNTDWDHRTLSWWESQIGTFEGDSSLVMRDVYPPYYDLETGEFRGFVEFKLLVDNSCTECYDANQLADNLITSLRLIAEKEEVDIQSEEGMELIERYNITKVPTFIVNDEIREYPGFDEFWLSTGNPMGEDGWIVFRTVEDVGAYYITLDE